MRSYMMRGRLYLSREDDWKWLSSWIGGIIKELEEQGYTEEQIIAELSKYGDVKTIEGERQDEKKKY